MKAIEFITETVDKKKYDDFLKFACAELGIDSLPKIKLTDTPIENEHSVSFACFTPSTDEITMYIKNRHILDIFRSLAHELVHYKQKLEFGNDLDGSTGSDHENEANSVAGQIMRKYNKTNKDLF